jgi:hypothetical protein
MSKYRKTIAWVLGGVGAFLAILIVFLLLAPMLVNLEPFKEKIAAEISRKIGGDFEAQTIDLSFFPRPRIKVHQGRISLPDKVSGTFGSMTIYPKFLQLLMGNVEVARLNVERPEIRMELPGELKEREEGLKALSLKTMEEKVGPFLVQAISKTPGLVIAVEKGRLHLFGQSSSPFQFHDIRAHIVLGPVRVTVEISCGSDIWESFVLEGWLSPEEYKGQGHLELTRFHPETLTGHLFPLVTPRIKDSEVDLDLRFKVNGSKAFQIDVKGLIPSLTLQKGKESLTIKNTRLKGTFHHEEWKTTFSLPELNISYPSLSMSGKLSIDPVSPLASLEINSKGMDVAAFREAVLFLGEKVPLVQTIFEILREGKIPGITLEARGPSIDELGKEKNLTIRGSIVGGKVFVPEGGFHLEDVKGNAVISQGLLRGENLEARLGNSRGMKGTLRLGLRGEEAPLRLDIILKADLAQLPPHLERLVKSEAFRKEVALISGLRGSVLGRLILDRRAEGTEVKVHVSDFHLQGVYRRLPYPVEVEEGKFSLDTAKAKIALENLRGRFGGSSFSQLTAGLEWEKEPYLEVISLQSKIVLEEIDSWLISFEGMRVVRERLRLEKGTVSLNGELKGPFFQPKMWRFRLKGEAENVAVESAAFPGILDVTRGDFEATPERLSLAEVHVRVSDATLSVSGTLDHFLEDLDRVDLLLQGEIGPEGMQRIYDFIPLPPEVRIRSPVSLSKTHLIWEKNGKTSFSGDLDVKQGPAVSIDVLYHSGDWFINPLVIEDETSRASMGFRVKENVFDLDFRGELTKITLDRLLLENRFLSGWIKGDFLAQVRLGQPIRSVAQGDLEVAGLDYPLTAEELLRIESLSLEGEKESLTIKSAHVTLGQIHLTFSGDVSFPGETFLLNMDLTVDHLDLDDFMKKAPEKKKGEGDKNLWGVPMKGTLRVKSEDLKYGGFTWRPVHAEITLDPEKVNVTIREANLCGIDTPGILEVTPEGFQLHFQATAKDQALAPALTCLWDQRDVQGQFDLTAEIVAGGKREELARSLRGNLHFTAKDGRIYRFGLLAKIFALLNVTEIFRGKLPDLLEEGFAYNSMEAKGGFQDGRLVFEEAVVDGSSMDIACKGFVDPVNKKIDLTVLVAPFKTIDRIIRAIPLVGYLLGGKLVSVPVRVTGDLEDPTVIPFSASAVGSELIEMMSRTLHLPFKIIQPLLPEEQEKELP